MFLNTGAGYRPCFHGIVVCAGVLGLFPHDQSSHGRFSFSSLGAAGEVPP